MLSNLRLMYVLPDLISAVKSTVTDFRSEICWVGDCFYTIHVRGSYAGHTYSAWGADKNESVAFAKAVMELVERLHLTIAPTFWRNLGSGIQISNEKLRENYPIVDLFCETSSGVAAHLDQKMADKGAVAEIIERHVLTKATLECIGPNEICGNHMFWNGPLDHHVCLTSHSVPQSRVIFASGAHTTKAGAMKSADREISSMREWSKNPQNIHALTSSFEKNRPSEIQAYFLKNETNLAFLSQVSTSVIGSDISASDIWIADIPLLPHFREIGSLHVTRAMSPRMQPLQFGPLANYSLNPLAIDLTQVKPTVEFNVVA